MIKYILAILILCSVYVHCDETKDDHLPKKYEEAREIIKKVHKREFHESYLLMDAAARRDDVQLRNRFPSGGIEMQPVEKKQEGRDLSASDIPAVALAMLKIPPPPPRDYAHEPGVQFAEGVSQEFIAWATIQKQQVKK